MPPSQVVLFLLLGLQGAKPLEAPPTVPKIGSKIDQKLMDGYAFFMCIAVQSHRKLTKGQKF